MSGGVSGFGICSGGSRPVIHCGGGGGTGLIQLTALITWHVAKHGHLH